jgi:hypothetical protein
MTALGGTRLCESLPDILVQRLRRTDGSESVAAGGVGLMPSHDEGDFDDTLRSFFRSVLAYLASRLRGKVSDEKIRRLASEVIEGLRDDLQVGGWDDALPVTIEQAKRKSRLQSTVRIYAHIAELKDPQIVTVDFMCEGGEAEPADDGAAIDAESASPAGDRDRFDAVAPREAGDGDDADSEPAPEQDVVPVEDEATCVRIRDAAGSEIWSLEVFGPDLLDKLQDARRSGLPVEFMGVPIAVPAILDRKRPDASFGVDRQDIVFQLLDVRPSNSALNMVAASRDERQSAEEERAALSAQGRAPLQHMIETLIIGLGIAATNEFPLLRDLIEFVVLQSLAIGRITHASGRLHLLLVGPPGQGKKLVGVAARMLNPACSELSASKVSPAGLIGASHYGSGGWTSNPGLLPRAAHGVALLQDAHGWSDAVVRQIGPILQEVIEDGVVRSAVAGGVERAAPVGLILDANRTGQLDASRTGHRPEAAILRLRPLLSRVDVIVEIPEDPDRPWHVAKQMYGKLVVHQEGATEPPWARPLRLLVATLRDRYPTIDLVPVRGAMEAVHTKLHADNREVLRLLSHGGDVPTRLAISFARLVAASARAHDRGVACDEDVEVALKFVNMKLRYLKLHQATHASVRPDVQDERQDWVRNQGSVPVTATDLATRYRAETGMDVSERTIRRDFIALGGRRVAKDIWMLPPRDLNGHPDGEGR